MEKIKGELEIIGICEHGKYICRCSCGNTLKRTKRYWEESNHFACKNCLFKIKRLTEEQQALATRYYHWAHKIILPLKRRFPLFSDEIESAAMLGLTKAAARYDLSKAHQGYQLFNKFALYCIRSNIHMSVWLKHSNKYSYTNHELDFDQEVQTEREVAEVNLSSLSEIQRIVIKMHFFDSLTLVSMQNELHLSKRTLGKIKSEALEILRKTNA